MTLGWTTYLSILDRRITLIPAAAALRRSSSIVLGAPIALSMPPSLHLFPHCSFLPLPQASAIHPTHPSLPPVLDQSILLSVIPHRIRCAASIALPDQSLIPLFVIQVSYPGLLTGRNASSQIGPPSSSLTRCCKQPASLNYSGPSLAPTSIQLFATRYLRQAKSSLHSP